MAEPMRTELAWMLDLDRELDNWAIPDETRTDRGDQMSIDSGDKPSTFRDSPDYPGDTLREYEEPDPEPPPTPDYEPTTGGPKDGYIDTEIIPQPGDGPYGQQL